MKILLIFKYIVFFLPALSMAKTLVDPTKPAQHAKLQGQMGSASDRSGTNLKLDAIINSAHGKQAIINGKNVKEGQLISGLRVVSIGKNQVVLADSDSSQTLFVNNNNIKKDIQNGF